MEKRHYIEVLNADATTITSFSRNITVDTDTVTGYTINGYSYNITADNYDLIVSLPTAQPFKDVIAYTDSDETWTKDGLFLHNSGEDGTINGDTHKNVYIKDFLELVPDTYQASMIDELTSGDLNEEAEYLINNTINPKEFDIIYIDAGQNGIQDQIVAFINNIYYVNSMNDYVPYGNSNNTYASAWAIPKSIYDPTPVISNGIRSDMVLKSNKLIYLMRFEGMAIDDATQYLVDSNNSLVYLNTVSINSVGYQVYYNPKYLYDTVGDMTNPLVQSIWQTITVEDVFVLSSLQGKVLKVW